MNKDKLIQKNYKKIIVGDVIKIFTKIGYDTRSVNTKSNKFSLLVKSYQRHYRQSNVSGLIDKETLELLKKHCKDLLT